MFAISEQSQRPYLDLSNPCTAARYRGLSHPQIIIRRRTLFVPIFACSASLQRRPVTCNYKTLSAHVGTLHERQKTGASSEVSWPPPQPSASKPTFPLATISFRSRAKGSRPRTHLCIGPCIMYYVRREFGRATDSVIKTIYMMCLP